MVCQRMWSLVSTVNAMFSAPVDTFIARSWQEALCKEDLEQSAGGVQTRLLTSLRIDRGFGQQYIARVEDKVHHRFVVPIAEC
jgi:hypothetical protein